MKLSTHERGNIAEAVASAYLLGQGYSIMHRNVRTPFGEIDILARDGTEFVCVEVRSRDQSEPMVAPELTVTPKKYRRLVRSILSLDYLYNKPARIDIVTVEKNQVQNHYRDISEAFANR